MAKVKIGKEAAKGIVDQFYEYYELDDLMAGGLKEAEGEESVRDDVLELAGQEEDDLVLKAVKASYDALIAHSQKGRMEVDDSKGFVVVQILKSPMADGTDKIRWREPTARARVAMSKAKENDNEGKMLFFMGSIGEGMDAQKLMGLKAIDAALMETLATAFFLVG